MKTRSFVMPKIWLYVLTATVLTLSIATAPMTASAAVSISIDSPVAGQSVAGGPVQIAGTATAGRTVVVYKGARPLAMTRADGSGQWRVDVASLGNGSHTLTAKVIGNDGYGYFSSTNGASSAMNRLRLSDNVLNPGGDWPVATSGARLVPTAVSSGSTVDYHYMPGGAAALPGKFDKSNPADFADVSGYPASPGLSGGGFSLDGTKWYGVNSALDNVSVVDVATNTQVGTIAVGGTPQTGILGSDGRFYVGNTDDSTISVIDTNTDTVVATHTITGCVTPGSLGFMAFPSGEDYFYVACAQDGLILKLRLQDGSVLDTLDISATHGMISSMFLSPDSKTLYVSGMLMEANGNKVAIVDAATGTVNKSVTLSGAAIASSLTPDGQYLYAATQGAGFDMENIDVISTATGDIVTSIDTTSTGLAGVVSFDEPSTATSDVTFTLGAAADGGTDSVVKDGELAATGVNQRILMLGAAAVLGLTLVVARIRKVIHYRLSA